MANVFIFAAALLCLATAAQAQPKPLSLPVMGQTVQVDFVFDNAVRQTRDLPTAALRAARRKMNSGTQLSTKQLQSLADAGDGLAAYRFAKLLEERDVPDPTGVAAHYFAIAAYTGRAFAVPPLARLLKAEGADYGTSRLKHSLNAMTVQALSGNGAAASLLGQMYADGSPFGYDLAKAESYLTMTKNGGSPKAILQLGVALMSDPADASTGHPGARSALSLAAAGEDLSVRVTAENLLRLIEDMPAPQPEVTE
jgi:TPR repeat protein